MRIAFTNSTNRLVGGAERYIEAVACFLQKDGHETALWYEMEGPADRESFSQRIFAEEHGRDRSGLAEWIRRLKLWEPDVIFGSGLYDNRSEAETLKIAPSVFFVHNYDSTCISGAKCHARPNPKPCSRNFGPSCLLAFYPRRCGGLSPITLIKDYRKTLGRLNLIKAYSKVVTHTHHMAEEYRKHGVPCHAISGFSCASSATSPSNPWSAGQTRNLLFIGRMVNLKGGSVFLDALPKIARSLPGPIKVKFLGDGPARSKWQRQAALIELSHPQIKVEFHGWVTKEQTEQAIRDTHLHVLPSLWPEPFGMSGLEFGRNGIPTVAFNVGGIPDWLHNNVNGVLADYSEPLAENLANAIVQSLCDEHDYLKLRAGAQKFASSMTVETHCRRLLDVFNEINVGNRKDCASSHDIHLHRVST